MEQNRQRRSKRKSNRGKKKIKPALVIKLIIYGLGIFSYFYSQTQYANTLVAFFPTLLLIGLISGIISSLIIERTVKYYLFSIIFFGSLFTAIFFKLNTSFASSKEEKIKVRILYKALKSSSSDFSHVTVEYNDFNRDIEIDRSQDYMIGSAVFMVLTVRKGFLGYNIIEDKELVK